MACVRHVLDPFCGVGTVVALANAMGLDSTGVEVSAKRVRKAKVRAAGRGRELVTGHRIVWCMPHRGRAS